MQLHFKEFRPRLGDSTDEARVRWKLAMGTLRKEVDPSHESR